MSIKLNGLTYRVAQTTDGKRVVIVERGAVWRLTDQETAEKVLSGFLLAPLRMAA